MLLVTVLVGGLEQSGRVGSGRDGGLSVVLPSFFRERNSFLFFCKLFFFFILGEKDNSSVWVFSIY